MFNDVRQLIKDENYEEARRVLRTKYGYTEKEAWRKWNELYYIHFIEAVENEHDPVRRAQGERLLRLVKMIGGEK